MGYGTGRNVTTDNFFTSHELGQFLLTVDKEHNIIGNSPKELERNSEGIIA